MIFNEYSDYNDDGERKVEEIKTEEKSKGTSILAAAIRVIIYFGLCIPFPLLLVLCFGEGFRDWLMG